MENNSYARLLKAAKELKGARNEAAVALLLNISAQALHNWKRRGVPRGNLVEIEARIGAYPRWIATGHGDMSAIIRSDQSNDSLIIDVMNAMRFMSAEDMHFIVELCKRLSKERADADIHKDIRKTRKRVPVNVPARQTPAVSPFWSGGRAVERRKIDNSEWYGINRRKYERRVTSR
ncbi:MAG: hypothetical protein ACREXO_13565 [Advenella sp.]